MKLPVLKLPKDLAGLVGIARKETDPDKIEAALADARAQVATAIAERETAEAAYRDGLLDASPAESERQLSAASAAKVKVDRAEALVAALVQRLALARDEQDRANRKAIHDEARVKCDAIRARLPEEYRHHAMALRTLLRDLAEAEVARRRAEEEAPELGLIPSPEAVVRGLDAVPEEILDQREVELWVPDGFMYPLPEAQQAMVQRYSSHPRRGHWIANSSGSVTHNGGGNNYSLQRFLRVHYREGIRAPAADELWRSVSLPALDANGEDFVTPESFRSVETAIAYLARPMRSDPATHRAEHIRFEPVPISPGPDDDAGTVVQLERAA